MIVENTTIGSTAARTRTRRCERIFILSYWRSPLLAYDLGPRPPRSIVHYSGTGKREMMLRSPALNRLKDQPMGRNRMRDEWCGARSRCTYTTGWNLGSSIPASESCRGRLGFRKDPEFFDRVVSHAVNWSVVEPAAKAK